MKSLYEELGGTYAPGSDGMFYPGLTIEETDHLWMPIAAHSCCTVGSVL